MSTIKVTLTDEEVDQRRAHFCRARQRARLQPIPQHVLDYLLPRVRVEQYADEEGNVLGECWIWLQQTVPGSGTPRGNVGNKTVSLRRWIAEQMRVNRSPPSGSRWSPATPRVARTRTAACRCRRRRRWNGGASTAP